MRSITGAIWTEICQGVRNNNEESFNKINTMIFDENFMSISINLLFDELDLDPLYILLQAIQKYVESKWKFEDKKCQEFLSKFSKFINKNLLIDAHILSLCNEILAFIAINNWPSPWGNFLDFVLSYDLDEQNIPKISDSLSILKNVAISIDKYIHDEKTRNSRNINQIRAISKHRDKIEDTIRFIYSTITPEAKNSQIYNNLFEFLVEINRIMFFDCNIGIMNEIFINGCTEQIFPVLSKSILALNSFHYKTDQVLLDLSDVMQVYSENNVSVDNILEIPEFYTVFSDFVPQLFDFFKLRNEITPYIIDKMTNLVIILSQKILNGENLQDQLLKFLSFFNRQYLVAISYIASQNSFYSILHDTIPSVLESIVNTIPLQFSIESDTITFEREVKNSSYHIYETIICSISRLAPNLVMDQIRKAYMKFMNEQNAFENFIKYVSIFTTVTMFALKGLPHGSAQEIVKETNNWFFTQLENPTNSDENILFLQKIILYYYSEQRDLYHKEENQEFLSQIYFLFYQHLVVEDFVHQMFTAECLRLFLDYDYKTSERDNLSIQPYLRSSKDNERLIDNIGPAFQNVVGNILPPVIIPFMKFNFVVFQMTTIISISNPELLEVVRDFEDSLCNILFQFVGQSIIEINPNEILSMETMIIACKLCHYFPLLPYKDDNIFNDVINQLFVNFQNITKLFHDFCMKNNVSSDSLASDEANTMRKWLDSLLEGYIETIKAFDKPEFKYIIELIQFFMNYPPYLLVPGIFKLLKESLKIFKDEIVKNEIPTFYLDIFLAENIPHNCISQSIEMIFTYIELFSDNLMKLKDHMARIIQRVLFYCDYGDVEISLTAHKILSSIISKIEKSSSEIHQFYYNQPFPDESLQYTVNQIVFMEIIRFISCGVFKFAFSYYKDILHLRYFIQGVKSYLDEIADFVAAKLEVPSEKMKECIAPFILSTAKMDEEKFSRYLTAFFNKMTEITYFDPELHLNDNLKPIDIEKLISDASKVKDEAIPLFEPVETELLDV